MTTRFDSKRVVFYVKMILWGGDKLRASFFVNFALDLRGCLMQLHSIFTLGVGGLLRAEIIPIVPDTDNADTGK